MNVIPLGLPFSVGQDTYVVRRDLRGLSVWVELGGGRWLFTGRIPAVHAEQDLVIAHIEKWVIQDVIGS